jgi:hypothetical protein
MTDYFTYYGKPDLSENNSDMTLPEILEYNSSLMEAALRNGEIERNKELCESIKLALEEDKKSPVELPSPGDTINQLESKVENANKSSERWGRVYFSYASYYLPSNDSESLNSSMLMTYLFTGPALLDSIKNFSEGMAEDDSLKCAVGGIGVIIMSACILPALAANTCIAARNSLAALGNFAYNLKENAMDKFFRPGKHLTEDKSAPTGFSPNFPSRVHQQTNGSNYNTPNPPTPKL